FFSSRRRHTRSKRDWSSDVCSSDLTDKESQLLRQRRNRRRGFTLLEVLLAAAIGVLLLAALYIAMEVQLNHARAGREAVEHSLLARALLRRMSNDIAPSLGAPLPNTASGGATPSGTPTGTGTPGATATPTSTSNPATTSTTSATPVLNLQGDSGTLILWVSRITSDLSPTA